MIYTSIFLFIHPKWCNWSETNIFYVLLYMPHMRFDKINTSCCRYAQSSHLTYAVPTCTGHIAYEGKIPEICPPVLLTYGFLHRKQMQGIKLFKSMCMYSVFLWSSSTTSLCLNCSNYVVIHIARTMYITWNLTMLFSWKYENKMKWNERASIINKHKVCEQMCILGQSTNSLFTTRDSHSEETLCQLWTG